MTRAASSSPRRSDLDPFVILFSVTLLVSAALMFAVQPMAGKMLLPLVGSAPSGWLVAMTYFQLALLAGYYFAYKLSSLSVRFHGAALLLLLAAGIRKRVSDAVSPTDGAFCRAFDAKSEFAAPVRSQRFAVGE
jgi:hypothetical protein